MKKANLKWLGAVGLGSCNEEAVTTAQLDRRLPALAEPAPCHQETVGFPGKRILAEVGLVSRLGISPILRVDHWDLPGANCGLLQVHRVQLRGVKGGFDGLGNCSPMAIILWSHGQRKATDKEEKKKNRKKSETAASDSSIGLLPLYPTASR